MRSTTLPRCITALLAITLGGCLLVPDTFEGRYELVAIDEITLPMLFSREEDRVVRATSGFLDARADNTFVFSITFAIREGDAAPEVTTLEAGGFWSQTDRGVRLIDPGAESYALGTDGNEVRFVAEGRSYLFRP